MPPSSDPASHRVDLPSVAGPVLRLVSVPPAPTAAVETVRRVADATAMPYEILTPDQVGAGQATGAVTVLTPAALERLEPPGSGEGVPSGVAGSGGAVVLAADADDPQVLHRAVVLGCRRVLRDDDELGLLAHVRSVRDAVDREAAPRGRVLRLRPATGGAGASCLSAALALVAGPPAVLVDADADGPGIEPLLGDRWEGPGGARPDQSAARRDTTVAGAPGWSRLVDLEGQVDPAVLLERLPGDRRLRVVGHGSGPRAAPPGPRVHLVVEAAARAGALVVVDLPGRDGPADLGSLAAPGGLADPGGLAVDLLVVPCTVPGVVAAARRQAGGLDGDGAPRRAPWLVARRARAGLHPEEVADTLGLRLLADVRHDPRLDEHVALGLGVAPRRRSPWARAARQCLTGLAIGGGDR